MLNCMRGRHSTALELWLKLVLVVSLGAEKTVRYFQVSKKLQYYFHKLTYSDYLHINASVT